MPSYATLLILAGTIAFMPRKSPSFSQSTYFEFMTIICCVEAPIRFLISLVQSSCLQLIIPTPTREICEPLRFINIIIRQCHHKHQRSYWLTSALVCQLPLLNHHRTLLLFQHKLAYSYFVLKVIIITQHKLHF